LEDETSPSLYIYIYARMYRARTAREREDAKGILGVFLCEIPNSFLII